jgi:hypothetical protein
MQKMNSLRQENPLIKEPKDDFVNAVSKIITEKFKPSPPPEFTERTFSRNINTTIPDARDSTGHAIAPVVHRQANPAILAEAKAPAGPDYDCPLRGLAHHAYGARFLFLHDVGWGRRRTRDCFSSSGKEDILQRRLLGDSREV